MNLQVYMTGVTNKPTSLKALNNIDVHIVQNPYELRSELQNTPGEKVIIAYLPFLELRHFELYRYFQKAYENVQTFFVVQELSSSMKLKVKASSEFVVLWKTEEQQLGQILTKYLEGDRPTLRQDRRESHASKGLVSPSMLPQGSEKLDFQPIMPGAFENLSPNGSCLKMKSKFYKPKDFVHLSYQSKDGEYISIEGQVRWSRWNAIEQTQELGLRFVSSFSS